MEKILVLYKSKILFYNIFVNKKQATRKRGKKEWQK